MIKEKIKTITEKYEEEISLYKKLYENYLEQEKLQKQDELKEEVIDDINNLIIARGNIMKEIDRINHDIDFIKTSIIDYYDLEIFSINELKKKTKDNSLDDLGQTLKNIEKILEKIVGIDKKVMDEYKKYKIKAEEDLKKIRAGKKGFDAYSKKGGNGAYFMDKKK